MSSAELEDLQKGVWTAYGRAAYEAQCFEVQVASLILISHIASNPLVGSAELSAIHVGLSRRNLGNLLQHLGSRVTLPVGLHDRLSGWREQRNYLMHRFFFENANALLSPSGCERMTIELVGIERALAEADAIVTTLTEALMDALDNAVGFPKARIDREIRAAVIAALAKDDDAS